MLVLLVPIAGIVPRLDANIWLPVGVFDSHGTRQGLDVELVPWTWAEPEAALEESSTLLRGKSNPEVSNIHQTSRGKGQSRPGHSSSSHLSEDRLVRRTPSLAQPTAPAASPAGAGVNGARLFPGHDAHSGFGKCSQHGEPSLLQESSSSQG